jgi:hypothetical protein
MLSDVPTCLRGAIFASLQGSVKYPRTALPRIGLHGLRSQADFPVLHRTTG